MPSDPGPELRVGNRTKEGAGARTAKKENGMKKKNRKEKTREVLNGFMSGSGQAHGTGGGVYEPTACFRGSSP